MHLFSMWECSVHYEDGWFIYADGKGHCSVISEQRARDLESGYVLYQASQDVDRGGADPEYAYRSRGLRPVSDGSGREKYVLASYAADRALKKGVPVELKGILTIPERIGPFPVDMVYDEAFSGCTLLEKVILPETVASIGEKAFFGCTNLVEVILPRGVVRIGKDAFAGTQVDSWTDQPGPVQILGATLVKVDPVIQGEYVIPEQVTVIGDYAFADCEKLTRVIFHENVTHIGRHAFENCTALTEIRLPKSVWELGLFAFNRCSSLEEIIVPEGVRILNHFHGCTRLKSVSIPASVESILRDCFSETALMNAFLASEDDMLIVDHWLILYRVNSRGSLIMDDDIVGIADQDWLEHDSQNGFKGLKSVRLSANLKYIGANAFERTGITEVDLPNGLLSMGMSCFRGAPLRTIVIPGSVKELGQWALMDCESLEKVVFLGNTEIVQFAITGRKDKGNITIVAGEQTYAHTYAKQFFARYHLCFTALETERIRTSIAQHPYKLPRSPRKTRGERAASMNPNGRRRSVPFWDILLSYGGLAAVPAAIIGLLNVADAMDNGGFTTKRVVIILLCALVILALLLVEKYKNNIRRRLRGEQGVPANGQAHSDPMPARPSAPVSEKPGPAEAAHDAANWRIGWVSGVLDDIGLVYEKAEKDEGASRILSQLETQALAEARRYCGAISIAKEKPTAEGFDDLSAAERETIIALLGKKGIQARKTDVANKEIVVALSPIIQSIIGCAMFMLLNWLEKLDGALNERIDGKVTLVFQVPLGGRKGLVQWEMLIMQLYPWLQIRETSSNVVAVALPEERLQDGEAEAPTQPSVSVPLSADPNMTLEDAMQILRGKIIAGIAEKPVEEYELASLLWDKAADCFPTGGSMRWDGAWFYLDLSTGKLSAKVSTYPNQFGASYDDAFTISASEFHRIAEQYSFSPELRLFRTEEDWEGLFDDSLKAATADALAEIQRLTEEKQATLREKYAVQIPSGTAVGLPEMSIRKVVLELIQPYATSRLTLTKGNGVYILDYELRSISHTQNRSYRREVSATEAVWVEERVGRAIRDRDSSTWQSLPGGDTMNIEICREKHGDIRFSHVKPMRKYSDLLRDLENLTIYGSSAPE